MNKKPTEPKESFAKIVDVTNLKFEEYLWKKCEAKEMNKICYDDDQCILFTGGKSVKVFRFVK